MKRSGSLPPPGSYDPRVLPSGKKIGWDDARARGGLIPKGPKFATNVEEAQKRSVPGPGAYETNTSTVDLPHGVRIAQPVVDGAGRTAWAVKSEGPGPAAYAIDPFARKERLAKQGRPDPLQLLQMNMKSADEC
jgi:hypothetical protein